MNRKDIFNIFFSFLQEETSPFTAGEKCRQFQGEKTEEILYINYDQFEEMDGSNNWSAVGSVFQTRTGPDWPSVDTGRFARVLYLQFRYADSNSQRYIKTAHIHHLPVIHILPSNKSLHCITRLIKKLHSSWALYSWRANYSPHLTIFEFW